MTERAETLDFPVTATGARQAATEFDQLGKSMTQRAGEWEGMSKNSSRLTAGLGAMSTALGPLGDGFGALGQNVSRATGIITNMTALLGGPWGIALGVATATVGFLSQSYAKAADEADALTEAAERQASVFQEMASSGTAARLRERRAVTDQQAIDDATASLFKDADARKLAEMEAFQEAYEAEHGTLRDRNQRGGGSGGGGAGRDPALEQQRRTQLELVDAEMQASKDRERMLTDELKIAEAERTEVIRIETEQRNEIDRMAREEKALALQQEFALEQAAFAQRRAMHMELAQIQQAAARDTLNLGMRSLNEWVKGNKVTAKQVVQSIGDTLVAHGTNAIWQGMIWNATPYQWGIGTPLIVAGSAAVGVGLSLGAASRGMSGGGGGGGGGGGINPTTQQLAPATPVSATNSTGGGNQQTVINVTMPTVISPSAEDGERINLAIEEAKRQGRI